jgi:hypothetical protein
MLTTEIRPGDRLIVRETFGGHYDEDVGEGSILIGGEVLERRCTVEEVTLFDEIGTAVVVWDGTGARGALNIPLHRGVRIER